ncbi:SMI1/KNR4 family protein [Luteimonas sp. WGS1318]|uniref:SMI1/KNR4 family protein n=1 Tax=Luteimonas sp. WGS1318 TaxID=3366815 RepID=UPI00372D625D
MNNIKQFKVKEVIADNSAIVNFGSGADWVGDEWISMAEERLGLQFTDSYKWFLSNYRGGEIGSEEIYSVYGIDFESANGGDIVFQNLQSRSSGLIGADSLIVSETDMGEVFYLDYKFFSNGECPVRMRLPSGQSVEYASDFYDYLCERIICHMS